MQHAIGVHSIRNVKRWVCGKEQVTISQEAMEWVESTILE